MKNKINANNLTSIKHVLFDYDGILVDSEKIYYQTWCSVLNKKGQKICADFHKGHHESEVFEKVKSFLKLDISFEQISNHRKILFDKIVSENGLKLIPNIKILLKLLSREYPLSIVSNSEREIVENGIIKTGVEAYFQNLFCFNEMVRRKPHPDLYHIALKELKLKSNNVIAIEDSISGLESAIKANIEVICINNDKTVKFFCEQAKLCCYDSVLELIEDIQTNDYI